MTGRLRYVLAAAFVVLFYFMYRADVDAERLAFLQTRSWLTADEDGSPFKAHAVVGSAVRPLRVVAQGKQERWVPEYERVAREWARSKGHAVDPALPPMQVDILVGDDGFQSAFTAPGLEAPLVKKLLTRAGVARERAAAGDAYEPPPGYYPDVWSLLPAFLAIVLAIVTGKVIPSLALGCLAGTFLYTNSVVGSGLHLARATIWERILTESFNLEIMLFVVFLFMAVGIMTRAGGIQGMVEWLRRYAKGPVSSQVCAYLTGLLIFFDDYSNCVIAGSTMRPLTDRNRVSREKLSYIVDATAAPIAGVSMFSTWVAYEISMFAPQLPEVTDAAGVAYQQNQGFEVFVQTLPFRFYCVFTLIMVLATIVLRREFGSMLGAERRALHEGKPIADDARPMVSEDFDRLAPMDGIAHKARNALIPVGTLVALTLGLIFWFGHTTAAAEGENLDVPPLEWAKLCLKYTASQTALFWASMVALVLAALMAVGQRLLTARETVLSAYNSAKALGFAVVILILAWSIGNICGDLGTNQFLTAAFGHKFEPWLLPAVLFALSSLVAFSTGTSYGTMAILLPNVVVLAHTVGAESPIGGPAMMMLTIGAVLEGSIFGDHCSPISDTTVLSSVSTGSDHMHHVRTQAPYALLVMIVAMVCGYLPMTLAGPEYWYISWGAGALVLVAWLLFVGRSPQDP